MATYRKKSLGHKMFYGTFVTILVYFHFQYEFICEPNVCVCVCFYYYYKFSVCLYPYLECSKLENDIHKKGSRQLCETRLTNVSENWVSFLQSSYLPSKHTFSIFFEGMNFHKLTCQNQTGSFTFTVS